MKDEKFNNTKTHFRETKSCQNCQNNFTITPDDLVFYEKVGVPESHECPSCRMRNRMLFRNDRTFYRRTCDLCKKSIISTYHESAPHPVYCAPCFWSDNWDPTSYGRDIDFSRPFFDQLYDLYKIVPALAILNDNGIASVNCEYNYDWFYSKNCYMNAAGWHAENVLYSYHIEHNKDIIDSMHMRESELAYECMQCYKIARSSYLTYSSDSTDCHYGYDLRGCSDCLMCFGLRNKRYCIKNVEYTKEEYEKILSEINFSSRETRNKMFEEFKEFYIKKPHKFAYILKSVNSTGDFIVNSKNSKNSFMMINGENNAHCFISDTSKDTYDCDATGKSELSYYSMVADEATRALFTVFCMRANEVYYSLYSSGASWCFGCISHKKGSYSILNKKYTKEEYQKLKAQLIDHMKKTGEWGEFFPKNFSSYAYNESSAQEIFPLTKNEALDKGYSWRDPSERNYTIDLETSDVPDDSSALPDDISTKVTACADNGKCLCKCTTAFKVTPDELILYKKLKIPLPILCPNCRHARRISRRNPPKLFNRTCMKEGCENEFETSYYPERPEIVYCEKCYQQEVN